MRVYRSRGSLELVTMAWSARIVWRHGRMGYRDRWRWLAPVSTRVKFCRWTHDDLLEAECDEGIEPIETENLLWPRHR